ncbi:SDR family NAD(P)-dependent oxidoreductase [Pseudonocardia sp. H11422]|uniref:SDR family NAD(P)-dependent oxidoreductase n=1 Tax=Pseudonocardia sp. H11422 TaxID=2835866 RepID=UPI001BDD7C7F|nr:glucose 1-dehydrogenase [Pseudonocardia sp. H11422]
MASSEGRLAGKHAIVTGGASGIGSAVSEVFAREGARVIVADYNHDGASETASRIVAAGGEALAVQVDVGDSASVEAMFKAARAEFGPVDIVHNPAGNFRGAMSYKMTEEDFDEVIRVHLKGTYLCLRAAVNEWMERRSGKFIAVTSPAAVRGQIGGLNYAAAKAGVHGLVKTAARELAKHNIQVNAVLPMAATPMNEKIRTDPKLAEKFNSTIPMERYGDPTADIAPAVVYLASEESNYVTGIILPIDGGRTI